MAYSWQRIACLVLRQLADEGGDQHSEKLLQSRGLSPPDAVHQGAKTLHSGPFVLPSLATSSSNSPDSACAGDAHLHAVQRQAFGKH